MDEETKKKISLAKKGIPVPQERREKIRKTLLGRKNPEHSKRMKEKYKSGSWVPWAKGKFLSESRVSKKYKSWVSSVLQRDENKCQKCGRSESLHCHHIIPWKIDVSKRFDINNGITLCPFCHGKEDREQRKNNGQKTRFKNGHPVSEEVRKKISFSNTGKVAWNRGIKTSEETRKKQSLAKLGKPSWNKGNRAEIPDEKECKDCKIVKKIFEFTPLNRGLHYSSRCKMCRNMKLRKRRIND